MISRRMFVGQGLGVLAAGSFGRLVPGRPMPPIAGSSDRTDPVALLPARPESVLIDGLPFAPWFTGDDFPAVGETHLAVPPFTKKLDDLPEPQESVRVAIIGAGISGLACAYMLRDYEPVLLDIHERFGGAARGERWAGTEYSLGNAYVIVPDKGSFLEEIYRDLGLDEVFRLSRGDDPVAIDGTVLTDFWVNGFGGRPDEVDALAEYAEVVRYYAERAYPEIPFEPRDRDFIVGLDQLTLKQDIEQRMTLPVPPLLESAIQGYCYSSFGAGWERISAASGWNFLAAEEFGRWIFPGGTSFLARSLWTKLRQPGTGTRPLLRGGATVLDVRLRGGQVQVTWRDRAGVLHALLADRVVMACPKFTCKHMIHDLAAIDPGKADAMHVLQYTPYMVANVLMDAPLKGDFYDLFLMGESAAPLGTFSPCGTPFDTDKSPVTDVVNGVYAIQGSGPPRSVLTMYWPLQCPTARYEMVFKDPFERWAGRFAPQLDSILTLLGFARENVVQIRLSRWGHAMPVAAPFLIANGTTEALRRPIADRIYFACQDNWALPAVENSILDARIMTDLIRDGLG